MMKHARAAAVLLIGFAVLAVSGCSGSGLSRFWGLPVRFSGNVGADASSRALDDPTVDGTEARTVDTVLAVPFDNSIGLTNIRTGVVAEVAPDGSFSVVVGSLFENTVLMLLDSTAPLHESVVGYAALSDLDESLISFPATNAGMGTDVDLGNLSLDGTNAISDRSLDEFTVDFDVPIEELRARARMDDVLKRMKNLYINDHGERHWGADVTYIWMGDLAPAVNQESDPAAFAFTGANIQLPAVGYEDMFTFDDLYEQRTIMRITAPEPITYNSGQATGQVFSNEGDMGEIEEREVDGGSRIFRFAGADDFWIGDQSEGVVDIAPAIGILLPIPAGLWEVTLDDEPIAHFDVAIGSPFDEQGNPIVPMPSIRLSVAEDGRVTGISATFYEYVRDEGRYRMISEQAVIDQFLSYAQITMSPYTDGGSMEDHVSPVIDGGLSAGIEDMTEAWYYGVPAPEGGQRLGSFAVIYRMFGVSCMYAMRTNL